MFSNLEYLYQHIPAHYRREDRELAFFLKRFLQFFGEQLDGWDQVLDTFHEKLNPETAPEEFVDFWLWAFFRWGWYPEWFPLARKQRLYANFAEHLARRGTPVGIEDFLREFSVHARVYARPQYWGEFAWGEGGWTISDPLGLVVQINHLTDEVNFDVQGNAWGEFVWGEGYVRDTRPTLTYREIEDLIRFQWPNGQTVMIDYARHRGVSGAGAWDSGEPVLHEDAVPIEESGPVADWVS